MQAIVLKTYISVKRTCSAIAQRSKTVAIDNNGAGPHDSLEQPSSTVANPDQPYIDWIRAALARKVSRDGRKLTQLGIAEAIGATHPVVTRLLKGERRLKHWEIPKIAAYLGEPPPDIVRNRTDPEPLANLTETVKHVAVRGECAGGRWLEYEIGDDTYEAVPTVPTKYTSLEQFAFRVRGNSMDRSKILDGDYVICVTYFDARMAITDGDIVVVERRRAGLYERTCKIVRRRPDGQIALESNSHDPRLAEPLLEVRPNGEADDGVEIEIVGLVVGRYSPL